MALRYRVELRPGERHELLALLLCDRGPEGPAWTVARTAAALGLSSRTIEHLPECVTAQVLATSRAGELTRWPHRQGTAKVPYLGRART